MANQQVIQTSEAATPFFESLLAQQQTMWGENQTAINTLTKAWAPVISSGVVPYGYSAGLDQLLQASVLQTGATATANATNAAALQARQASGGAAVGPTGSSEAINALIQAKGQQSTATGLQQEKEAGYEQGLSNLEGATNAEMGIINATNPEKAAEAATNAGNLSLQAGNTRFQENQESSGLATFGKIAQGIGQIGSAVGSFAGAGLIPGGSGATSGGISTPGLDNIQGSNALTVGQMTPTEAPAGTLGPEQFHKGGVVKGRKGQEVRIRAKAGEYVIPAPKTKKQKTLLDRALVNARRGEN